MPFPLIPLLGIAAQILPDLFSSDKPLPEKAMAAVAKTVQAITGTDDPEAALKSLKNDTELVLKLREQVTSELKIYAADRADARNMLSKLASVGHGSAWAPAVISAIVVAGFFVVVYTIMKTTLNPASEKIVYMLLGTLAAGFTQVLNFWLGSSHGSKKKTEIMGHK